MHYDGVQMDLRVGSKAAFYCVLISIRTHFLRKSLFYVQVGYEVRWVRFRIVSDRVTLPDITVIHWREKVEHAINIVGAAWCWKGNTSQTIGDAIEYRSDFYG